MLIDFSVSNYLSFVDKATLSMERSSIQRHKEHIIDNNLLSGAVLYGANASGKTNFLQAISSLSRVICGALSPLIICLNACKFLDKKIPCFEINFIKNSIKYYYKLSFENNFVKEEELSFFDKNRKKMVFSRNLLDIDFGPAFKAESSWYNKDKTAKDDVPFLTTLINSYGVVENNIPGYQHFENAFEFFKGIEYVGERPIVNAGKFYDTFKKDEFKQFLLSLLKVADLGIREIDFVVTNSYPQCTPEDEAKLLQNNNLIITYIQKNDFFVYFGKEGKIVVEKLVMFHHGCENHFELSSESSGTIKLIHLSLGLFLHKDQETILIFDELDAALHPFLADILLKLLLKTKGNGQFIVSLHNTALLNHDIWRVDEIWFVEKSSSGVSRLYPLTDINPRFDKNLEKDYKNGKYGAIPFIYGDI